MAYPELQVPLKELCAYMEMSISVAKFMEERKLFKVYILQTCTELIKVISPDILTSEGLQQEIQEFHRIPD